MKIINKKCAGEGNLDKLPLPLRDPDNDYSNSKKMADIRLHNLNKRFKHDKKSQEDHTKSMHDMMSKDCAEVQDEKNFKLDKTRHIYHHLVFHARRSKKMIVLFDSSAEWHGISVIKYLMLCSNLTNQIIEVSVKFYDAFVADNHKKVF